MNTTQPTPKQVKAARALLAWTQGQLAKEAGIAVSTLADFERGERTPVANNAQAIAAALERNGIRFTGGGAVTAALAHSTPKAAAAGQVFRWVTAQHIAEWATRRDGPAGLPELISRLIVVSCGPVSLRFPSDESILHAGWDGKVETNVATTFVPEGQSVWELGAQSQRIGRKAEEDYSKRTANPLGVDRLKATYVFVTPHRWPQKDEWATAKRAEGAWKDVRVLDGDSLVHWLELHAGVTSWFAERIGRRPPGLRNLIEVWDEWSLATRHPLTPEILTADRDEEAIEVLRWLNADPSIMSVQAEAVDEAVAFLYAAINPLPDPYRLFWLSRTVVADTESMARQISCLNDKMVVVLLGGDPGLSARLVRDGHHVFAAYGSDVGTPSNIIRLPRPWRYTLEVALRDAGIAQPDAHKYANASGRSLAVLRRLMPASPIRRPEWAQPPVSSALLGAMLAGAWDRDFPVDREIVARLCGVSYDTIEAQLVSMAVSLDGPMRRSGEVWKLTSLRDAWFLLSDQLTTAQVDTLISIFQEVLGEVSPDFDDPNRRWRFDRSPPKSASPELRRGLSETVIALGVWPEQARGVANAEYRSAAAVRALLADADERRWWSLSNDFRRLAEAAPDAFLSAIEAALAVNPSPMLSLFRSDEGFLHPSEYLADLLWSLEILCWSAEYVGRATLILAKLAAIDPGGKMNNRPKETLARIFMPWRPQTFASPVERLQLLDAILRRMPQVGWDLLHAIAPTGHGVTHPTAKPMWRDFSTDQPEVITSRSLQHMYTAIGERLLDAAGGYADRWSVIIDHWSSFHPEWRTAAFERLMAAIPQFDDNARTSLRETLRAFISRHARFPNADWSLKSDELTPLREIFSALEPKSVLARHAWLFGNANPRFDLELSWDEMQVRLERDQVEAIEAILFEVQPNAIIDLAFTVDRPDLLGLAVALSSIATDTKEMLLADAFSRGPGKAEQFARGILYGFKRLSGDTAIQARLSAAIKTGRSEAELLALAFMLEANHANWALIASAGDAVEQKYWELLDVFTLPKAGDLNWITDKFLAVGRGRAILGYFAGFDSLVAPKDLILKVMRHPSTVRGPNDEMDGADGGMFGWYVGKVFQQLDTVEGLDQEIASLEWIYFQALRHSERPARSLYKALGEDPQFFVMLLKALYRSTADDEPELTGEEAEQAKTIASQAFSVLEEWQSLPGSDDDGSIDANKLLNWVREVRAACAAANRLESGDHRVGVMLSAAKRVPGEVWPPEAVRDVLEELGNDDIDQGFIIGLYNRRGVTSRMPTDGGDQERALAAVYRSDAKSCGVLWPRTRAVLERIAKDYEADAVRQDQRAEQRDW